MAAAQWELKAKERIKKTIAKYSRIVTAAQERKAGEADTRQIIVDFLADGLGWDKFSDITSEQRIKGHFVDFAVSVNQKPAFLIEAKPVCAGLNDNHLYQAINYAQGKGIEWALLTNGDEWSLYHLTYGRPVEEERAFIVRLTDKDAKPKTKVDLLFLLSHESFARRLIDLWWDRQLALSLPNIAKVILGEPVLKRIRADLRKATGQTITIEDLRKVLEVRLS